MERLILNQQLSPLLTSWYRHAARDLPWRQNSEPYRVWVSEIMLQQTRVEAVIPYYTQFLTALPDIAALARADENHLLKLWEGLGYYSRARNLQKAARQILERHSGMFPNEYAAIRALSGIGDYTAGAIASICFDMPVPAVDGNVLRVISRIAEISESINCPAVKKAVRQALQDIYPADRPGDFTQALMELGATVCLPGNPRCAECPVSVHCRAFQNQTISQYPVRDKKGARKIERLTVLLLRCGDRLALRKRSNSGLLAGLWELPNLSGELDESAAFALAADWDASPLGLLRSAERVHIFTHKEWHMRCYEITCAAAPDSFVWADQQELAQEYSLPTAFRVCLQ